MTIAAKLTTYPLVAGGHTLYTLHAPKRLSTPLLAFHTPSG